jgi:hypothetical protein
MFSAEDYLQGWIVYSIGASCLILFLWLLLRKSAWTTARHLTLLVSAAVLLTPVTAYRDDSHLAPAVFALFFYLLIRLLWGFICRKRSGEKPVNKRLRGARLHAKQDPAT